MISFEFWYNSLLQLLHCCHKERIQAYWHHQIYREGCCNNPKTTINDTLTPGQKCHFDLCCQSWVNYDRGHLDRAILTLIQIKHINYSCGTSNAFTINYTHLINHNIAYMNESETKAFTTGNTNIWHNV